MNITIIGTGYVGLVSGVCFSGYGYRVTCVDSDSNKIARLQQHIMPIYEPGLEQMIKENRAAGRLAFITDLQQAVSEADIIIIAVGTPQSNNDYMPDLSALEKVAGDIAKSLSRQVTIIIKSTVPIGTSRKIARLISEINPDADFDIVSNPEFLREGAAVKDFMQPERIISGVDSKRAEQQMQKLYAPICGDNIPLLITSLESAEMIKYSANAFLATKIAFINEIADICEKTGANIRDVARGIGMDSRIGDKFLQPGPGYGGSCFPKDTLALDSIARKNSCQSLVVEATIKSNKLRKEKMVKKIIAACGGEVSGKTICILGVTFKPETNDMRESASLTIIPLLQKHGAIIKAFDPQGMKEAEDLLPDVLWCADMKSALSSSDAMVVLTEWNEFRSLNPAEIRALMKQPVIIDLRNIYKRQEMQKHGFYYASVGRQDVIPGQPWIADLHIKDEKI